MGKHEKTKAALISLFLLALTLSVMGQVSPDLKSITTDQVFIKLLENKADLAGGYAVFSFYCPIETCYLDKSLGAYFFKATGEDISSYSYFLESSETINIKGEWVSKLECSTDIKNGSKSCKDNGYFPEEYLTRNIWIPAKAVSKGEYKIKLVMNWKAHLGPQVIEWIPTATFRKTDYALTVDKDYSFSAVKWAWINSSWAKKKLITLNTTVSHGIQIKINVSYSSGMASDFDDLRFSNSTETGLLDYWIESKTDGSWAVLWVEMSGSSSSFYMYYSNPTASAGSNGDNTFEFFDDFNDGSISAAKWDIVTDANCHIEESSGNLLLHTLGVDDKTCYIRSDNTISLTHILSLNAKLDLGGKNVNPFLGFQNYLTDVKYAQFGDYTGTLDDTQSQVFSGAAGGGLWTSGLDGSTWNYYNLYWTTNYLAVEVDGTIRSSDTSIDTDNMDVEFFIRSSHTTSEAVNLFVDYTFVRNYVKPLPSASFGGVISLPNNPNASISPASIYTDTLANCSGRYSIPSGESGNLSFTWKVNGVIKKTENFSAVANNTLEYSLLSGGNFSRGDVLNCSILATVNISGTRSNYTTKTVLNSIPTTPTAISPDGVRSLNNSPILRCNGSTDGDGESIKYYFYMDAANPPTTYKGNATTGNLTVSTVAGTFYYWRCRAYDEINFSSYSSVLNFTENSPPAGSATVTPSAPALTDTLTCGYSASDADGDPISLVSYNWWESSLGWTGINSVTLASSYLSLGQSWKCRATVSDGYETTNLESSEVSIIYGCLTQRGLLLNFSSSGHLTLLNFSAIPYVYADLSNIENMTPLYYLSDHIAFINTTASHNVLLYINSFGTNITKPVKAVVTNANYSLSLSNFSTVNNIYTLSWSKEDIFSPWNTSLGSEFKTLIYCSTYGTSEINTKGESDGLVIVTKETPDLISQHLNYTYQYFRGLIPSGTRGELVFYMIETSSYTPLLHIFSLNDLTKQWAGANIHFKKYAGGSLEDMTADVFGADYVAYAYLEENARYIVTIDKGGTSRTLGWMTLTAADLTHTITLTGITYNFSHIYTVFDYVTYNYTYDQNTGLVCFSYLDTENLTNWVYWNLKNVSNEGLVFSDNSTSSDYMACYGAEANHSYILTLTFSHPEGSTLTLSFLINAVADVFEYSGSMLGLESGTFWLLAGLFFLSLLGFGIGAKMTGAGAVGIFFVTLFLSAVNVFPFLSTSNPTGWLTLILLFLLGGIESYNKSGAQ